MADRFKLVALLSVAFIALCALVIIVYNFGANNWRLDSNPLDITAITGGETDTEATEIESDDRYSRASHRFGDSIRAVRVVSESLGVELRRAETSQIEVLLILTGDATDTSRFTTSLRSDPSGTLEITTRPTGAGGNASGVLYLTLPPHLTIDISTGDGDLSAENINGRLALTTSTGSIDVSGVRGTVSCSSGSGSISLDACKFDSLKVATEGPVALSRTEGVIVARCDRMVALQHFGALDAEGDGDIVAEVLSTTSPVRLVSNSGNVLLRVLNGARFAYDVAAPAGSISADVPFDTLTAANATQHFLRATMNGGGIPALIRAVSGNVEILLFEADETSLIEYVEPLASPWQMDGRAFL